jgi:hypothetical protein
MKLDGRGTRKDVQGGRDLLERSCDAGARLSCHVLGLALAGGRGVKRDKAAAIKLFKRACAMGHDPACVDERKLDR